MLAEPLDILMYHSISAGAGPTCIAPQVFAAQLDALAESGRTCVSLAQVAEALSGGAGLPPGAVALTFDDGFCDFQSEAHPLLAARGWSATVFVPTGHIGGFDDWERHDRASPARRLMSWEQITELAASGIDFGAHAVTHRDLTRLAPAEALAEIDESQRSLTARLGRAPAAFAAPFGRTHLTLRGALRQRFALAVGTRFSRATPSDDVYNLPRIEMWYFRDPGRWRRYLAGRARAYVLTRRLLRGLRGAMSGGSPLQGVATS